ncbi:hypothetical protein FQZ97_878980 [compost metagenome]
MHIGAWPFQQGQVATLHRACCAGQWAELKVQGLAVAQGALVGRGQPGVAEAAAQPAFGGFQQALFGDLLDGGEQRQIEFVGGHVAGDQLEHHVAPVEAPLAHQYPVVPALPGQGQAHRNPQVGQLHGEALVVAHLDRTAPAEHLAEIQRPTQALVAQSFRAGLDEQGQGLEGAGVFAVERARHVDSWMG